jgi:hypothetical protein
MAMLVIIVIIIIMACGDPSGYARRPSLCPWQRPFPCLVLIIENRCVRDSESPNLIRHASIRTGTLPKFSGSRSCFVPHIQSIGGRKR